MNSNGTTNGQSKPISVSSLLPVAGNWEPQNSLPTRFLSAGSDTFKIGVALCPHRAKSGQFGVTATLSDAGEGCAGIVFGYDPAARSGYFAGIGGWESAYALGQFRLDAGASRLLGVGSRSNLSPGRPYRIEASLTGVELSLSIDGVEVFSHPLNAAPSGDQVGLYAYGNQPVSFENLVLVPQWLRAFVVMQFSEPYNSLWDEVIRKVAKETGFTAFRGDDVYSPGIILQDIVRAIRTSDVVIAEVTPRNPNVYYELGYAHATGTPTILLAEKAELQNASLPFDISGFRCIFYEDAIRGKQNVEEALRRHLVNIREQRGGAHT